MYSYCDEVKLHRQIESAIRQDRTTTISALACDSSEEEGDTKGSQRPRNVEGSHRTALTCDSSDEEGETKGSQKTKNVEGPHRTLEPEEAKPGNQDTREGRLAIEAHPLLGVQT